MVFREFWFELFFMCCLLSFCILFMCVLFLNWVFCLFLFYKEGKYSFEKLYGFFRVLGEKWCFRVEFVFVCGDSLLNCWESGFEVR